jgi:sec-independent protein translocase protein TatA
MPLGLPELLIILVIIIILFGVGRLSKIGSELGKGISAFRTGLNEGKEEPKTEEGSVANRKDDNVS